MSELLFFSYHNTRPWWQYLADNVNFTKSVRLISDVREAVDVCIVDDFYNNLRINNCEQIALRHFSVATCEEIIRRCRVLRNLEQSKALSMIGSMYLVFDQVIKKEKPRLVLSFIIDRYTLDVLARVLESYDIPFIGITASIVPDYVMLMDRGKLIPVRDPALSEIEQSSAQLLSDTFSPSYVANNKKYSLLKYWRIFFYFKMRGVFFRFLRYWKRDRLNLHYLDALNSLDHKPRLLDYQVLHHLNRHWDRRLQETLKNKRVFLALQLLPEASLDYWLDDLSLLNNERVVWEIALVLGKAGFVLFVKDHPLQFAFRKRELIKKLAKLPFVVIIPYEVSANKLIKDCSVTVTSTGTIGFQSVLAGACSIVSGAYYSDTKHFIHFHNLEDIHLLPQKIEDFQKNNSEKVPRKSIDELVSKILAASIPGDLFSFKHFNKDNPEHRIKVAPLLDSLNKYLPQFLQAESKA